MTSEKPLRPTLERLTKASGEYEERIIKIDDAPETLVVQMLDCSVLDRLLSRGQITGDHYGAGARFYGDWYAAGFASSGVVDPSKDVVDGGNAEPSQIRQLDAAGRWTRAVRAVGKIHSHVLVDLVLLEVPLTAFGRKFHGQANPKLGALAAVVSLRNALTELDHHYYGQRDTPIRHTHSPDYRPTKITPTPK